MPNNHLAALEFIARHGGTEGTEDGQLVEWDGLSCAAIAQRAIAASATPQSSEGRVAVDGEASAASTGASWDAFQLIADSKGWDTTKNAEGRWNDRTIQGAWFGYQAAYEADAAPGIKVDVPDEAVREAWRARQTCFCNRCRTQMVPISAVQHDCFRTPTSLRRSWPKRLATSTSRPPAAPPVATRLGEQRPRIRDASRRPLGAFQSASPEGRKLSASVRSGAADGLSITVTSVASDCSV